MHSVFSLLKMTAYTPPAPHQPNTGLNITRHSVLTGVAITATEVQITVSPIEHILTLLAANDARVESLDAKLKTTSEEMTHSKGSIDLSNKTNAFLKELVLEIRAAIPEIKNVMVSEKSIVYSAALIEFSPLMDGNFTPGKIYPLISHPVNSYMKKKNFKSIDLLKFTENNARSVWSITGTFGDDCNKSLLVTIIKYFKIHRCCENVPNCDIIKITSRPHQRILWLEIQHEEHTTERRLSLAVVSPRTKCTRMLSMYIMKQPECGNILSVDVMS
ncbi:hypothetical protein PHYBLDRAFT_171149 [Phycomyces blakesleeanus NRRL 1555(-)]|uniref:Uncharacterized protein n=1 Tax=Phycomyces blakesleeanus (strain ATCC 8743b / DSM 1359 / FGSC 10004 / NBRC 33097 / NRRL 1555) TaxID=763407 RepID=A0A167LGE4_PHYB8|nr:hypothetical protein PHYBLDRAFT_171149 [Phycomyces blakesleeanus NRRL 1555(-)]OAD70397.1 hypothetical protein PHYBLDRAFT_171149 [Phycomyces blakesleeanus NRRL 1555(-)]|eukprot:XP_018288437.1 hypothetical protein PHYBLDRAFT_171149 [Phycomyces blakesleeanus NRRL 1555(-)]